MSGGSGGGLAATGGTGGGRAGSPSVTFGGNNGITQPGCADKCKDFPADPIVDEGTPANPAAMFSGTPSGAAPCLLEPENGSLFPRNWLRARVHWTGTTGLHQITVSSPNQANVLTAYTTKNSWAIPVDIWRAIGVHAKRGEIYTVKVRSAGGGESTSSFGVAPVDAGGKMVFWAADPTQVGKDVSNGAGDNDSELRGFSVGDETTVSVLKIPQVEQMTTNNDGKPRTARCIGCHTATPDGEYVGFVDGWPWSVAIAGVKPGNTGKAYPGVTEGGNAAMGRPWGGMMAFSPAHWSQTDRVVVVASSLKTGMMPWSQDNAAKAELVWYDLATPTPPMLSNPWKLTAPGAQYGVIARTGDAGGAACPTWGHREDVIIYSSTMGGNQDGRLQVGKTDLYSVPYNMRAGGAATPVKDASDPAFDEYYPALSPDDKLIAYNRVPTGQVMYANPNAELYVVTRENGGSVRLKANDPPACSGKASPGVNNHWARWSPIVNADESATYYWVVFSSNRADIPPATTKFDRAMPQGRPVQISQLYVTAVVVTEDGILSYPAIYLWNQPTDKLNLTPAWEDFVLPPVE